MFSEDFVKAINKNTASGSPISKSIDQLQPISYFNDVLGATDYAFDIQQLQEYYPELVHNVDQQTKGVRLLGIIALLVQEVKDLKASKASTVVKCKELPSPVYKQG